MTSVQSSSSFISSKTVRYILIIAILAIAFSVSFMIRSQGAQGGFELAEFDPFFNYRATNFIVENGIPAYFEWWDDKSWFLNIEPKNTPPDNSGTPLVSTCSASLSAEDPLPELWCYTPENVLNNEEINRGRNVSETSQVTLHIITATLYQIFGAGTSLYNFTILFPVIIGSLTTVVIFAVVRTIGGTTAGLIAALLFSVSVPIILRGFIGWFKSEPLGIFLGLIAVYLCISGIKTGSNKLSFLRIAGAGVLVGVSMNAWGGSQFFLIILGLFFLALPFFRSDRKFIAYAAAIFIFTMSIVYSQLDPGSFAADIFCINCANYIAPLGFFIGGILLFVTICALIQKIKQNFKTSYGLIILGSFTAIGSLAVLIIGKLPSLRYQAASNPFLIATDPLTESVAEHAFSSLSISFFYHSIFMIFAVIGIWFIFQNKINKSVHIKNEMAVFALITGIIGIYLSSSFVRLELFASISLIILSSIGISILISKLFAVKKNPTRSITKVSFVVCITILLVIPVGLPADRNWVTATEIAPAIAYGGSFLMAPTNDWPDAMLWLKTNTPEDAKILSWWDYGYWIETLGDRTTYADGATLDTQIIKKTAQIFYSSPDDAWKDLVAIDADYVLIWITAEKVLGSSNVPMHLLGVGGGDEAKRFWFAKVAEVPLEKYFFDDYMSGPNTFWHDTLLGKMIPFSPVLYLNPANQESYNHYQPNTVGVYVKNLKLPSDGNGPLELAYTSPSFERTDDGEMSMVLIYKVNKDYNSSFEYNILDD